MNPDERWQLVGNAAAFYDRYVRLLMEPWVSCLVDVAALQQGEDVLDLACGTGFVARLAAQHVGINGRVVGIDLNASMIEVARAMSYADHSSTIEWRTGDAADLPFASSAFDVVLCQQGLQFFPDRGKALREMRRVLRPGSRLALTVWSAIAEVPYQAALADALAKYISAEAGSIARAPCALHDAAELEGLIANAGFRSVHVDTIVRTTTLPLPEDFVPGHLNALPIAEAVARLDPDRRAALVHDMAEALRPYVNGEHLEVPASVKITTAVA